MGGRQYAHMHVYSRNTLTLPSPFEGEGGNTLTRSFGPAWPFEGEAGNTLTRPLGLLAEPKVSPVS